MGFFSINSLVVCIVPIKIIINNMTVKRVLICGLGLLGGSLARALRMIGIEVYAVDVDSNALSLAEVNGWINQGILLAKQNKELANFSDSYEIEAIREVAVCCDMIILATPLQECSKMLRIFAGYIPDRVVITDIGSVKVPFLHCARALLGKNISQYVAAHPIAGSELFGVSSSKQDLFKNRKVILCNFEGFNEGTYSVVADMWNAIGADVSYVDIASHDRIFSATSHIPHFLAFASVNSLNNQIGSTEGAAYEYVKKHTRIAAASAGVWSGIFEENKENILSDLNRFKKLILDIRSLLSTPKGEVLFGLELCSLGNPGHPLQRFFSTKDEQYVSLSEKFLHLSVVIVFCYLKMLSDHPDFKQLKYFLGSGFEDFACLGKNFSCFCNEGAKINSSAVILEIDSFLSDLSIFENFLASNNIGLLSEKIKFVSELRRMWQ